MSNQKKQRYKDHALRREAGGYVPLPHVVIRSEEFSSLSPFAVKALLDLLAQYRGDNNGDLCAAWTLMRLRGWRSKDSLAKGLTELRDACFLIVTRQGGKHRATLFGISFYSIDFCGGKLDLKAPTRVFMGTWHRKAVPLSTADAPSKPAIPLPRRSGQLSNDCPAGRVNSAPVSNDCPAGRVSQPRFPKSIDPPAGLLSRDTTTRSAFAGSV
jgi:hypothetical protein